jgi:glycosyltransferase involved in cell wall biosynthesis
MANYASFAATATLSARSVLRGADALWFYSSPPTVVAPVKMAALRGGPRVMMHLMDLWPDSLYASGFASSGFRRSHMGLRLEQAIAWTYDAVDVVAYISPGVGRLLVSRGADESKLRYVPLWADESTFFPRARDLEARQFLGVGDRVVLLYAGQVGETQGLDTLLDACELMKGDDGFVCFIVGTGTALERLRADARQRSMENVRFLGSLAQEEIPSLLAAADAVYVGLRDDPGMECTLPSKIQATLASGRPIIASLAGDAAAVVEAAGGWVCKPGDVQGLYSAILSMTSLDQSALDARGIASRNYYESEFSLARGVGRVVDALAGG